MPIAIDRIDSTIFGSWCYTDSTTPQSSRHSPSDSDFISIETFESTSLSVTSSSELVDSKCILAKSSPKELTLLSESTLSFVLTTYKILKKSDSVDCFYIDEQ